MTQDTALTSDKARHILTRGGLFVNKLAKKEEKSTMNFKKCDYCTNGVSGIITKKFSLSAIYNAVSISDYIASNGKMIGE